MHLLLELDISLQEFLMHQVYEVLVVPVECDALSDNGTRVIDSESVAASDELLSVDVEAVLPTH